MDSSSSSYDEDRFRMVGSGMPAVTKELPLEEEHVLFQSLYHLQYNLTTARMKSSLNILYFIGHFIMFYLGF
jgi:hypothetical protein